VPAMCGCPAAVHDHQHAVVTSGEGLATEVGRGPFGREHPCPQTALVTGRLWPSPWWSTQSAHAATLDDPTAAVEVPLNGFCPTCT
jgi:hypothetical protein